MSSKSHSSWFLVALLVFGVVLVVAVDLGAGQTSSVHGTLTSDDTWTKADSPYVLTGDFSIAAGVTLTIEPGVTVDLADYHLQVDGTLHARGTSNDKIIFDSNIILYDNERITFTDTSESWDEQNGTGCIIENAVINSLSMVIGEVSPQISNNFFNDTSWSYMLTVDGGSPVIVDNTMFFNGIGISVRGGSPVISDNFLQGNSLHSDGIHSTGSEVIITRNTIIDNENGISSFAGSQIIEGNWIQNNEVGIYGCGTIRNNTIANCSTAISNPFYPSTINYNNIVNYSQNSIYMEQAFDVNATYNWWGTTDTEAIEQSIYDFEDNANLGKVTFEPFLTEPNPDITSPIEGPSPTVTPTPTPTPTPPPVQPTQETKLTLTCTSSTSYTNFTVYITGSLTASGVGIANAPVLLGYSVDSGESWYTLTTVTDNQGGFSFVWMPEVGGNYRLKAVWEGDSTYLAVNTTISFATTPFEQNVFSVATDSTLTELVFDSTKRELRFRVEGPDTTTGYADVYVSKSFLSDISDLKVYLDDEEIAYTTTSQSDSWIVSFTYSHSTHQVTINMNSPAFDESLIGQALVIGLPIIAVVLLLAIPKIRDRKSKTNSE